MSLEGHNFKFLADIQSNITTVPKGLWGKFSIRIPGHGKDIQMRL
jgi:hypothetical protein